MTLGVGIVGLPNVGKTTLFQRAYAGGAGVASYAFSTVEPNTAMVEVPDKRLDVLAQMYKPKKGHADRHEVRRRRGPGGRRQPRRGNGQPVSLDHPRSRCAGHGGPLIQRSQRCATSTASWIRAEIWRWSTSS